MTATDRYASLVSHADAGLGADEPDIQRFTRVSEREEFERARAEAERILRSDSPPTTFDELVDRTANAVDSKRPPTTRAGKHEVIEGNTNDHERTTDV